MTTRVSRLNHNGERYLVCSYALRRPVSFGDLTPAELVVAECVLEGFDVRRIARQRRVSERTVANQLARIYRKLGVSSRHELVALVFQSPHKG